MAIEDKVLWPEPGSYVVAVSGGVDSIVLLDLLKKSGKYDLVVAHINHGLRDDASQDEKLVHDRAIELGLNFYSCRIVLGQGASEAAARERRYEFLKQVKDESKAKAIITAHHLDDRLETMILNERRGAGWLGVSPLRDEANIKRPLIELSKAEIYDYAEANNLSWREDSTNIDPGHTARNKIRYEMSESRREELIEILKARDEYKLNKFEEVKAIVSAETTQKNGQVWMKRTGLLELDSSMSRDVFYVLLKQYFASELEIDFDAVVRLDHFYKTAKAGKRLPLSGSLWAELTHNDMVLYVAR